MSRRHSTAFLRVTAAFTASALFLSLLWPVLALPAPAVEAASVPVAESFTFPLDIYKVVQNGGEFASVRSDNVYHLGEDIVHPAGTPVYAIGNGIVRNIGVYSRFGTLVLIEHELPNGKHIVSQYGHLRTTADMPAVGENVTKGQYIGQLGSSGEENGYWEEHLHFGIRPGAYVPLSQGWVYWGMGNSDILKEWINPSTFIKARLTGDADPDGLARFSLAPATHGSAHIMSFANKDGSAALIDNATFFASPKAERNGADIAIGNVTGDKEPEIIVGGGPGGPPIVKVYDRQKKKLLSSFLAYGEDFRGGVRVATGDLNADGTDEIITGPGEGGSPHVRIFKGVNGKLVHTGIFPFDKDLRTGVDVAAGNFDGDKYDEILVGIGPGESAKVRIIDHTLKTNTQNTIEPYPAAFKGGVRVAAGDIDGDKTDEIILGAGPGGGPHFRSFEADGTPLFPHFFPFHPDFRGGIDVSATDWNDDGDDEILVTQASAGQVWTKVYDFDSQQTIFSEFNAYGPFEGGGNIAGF